MQLELAGLPIANSTPTVIADQVIEICSDSGEGAQTAGKLFGAVSAKQGNFIWTVELIPAEIEPPARSREGVSGSRVRFSNTPVTNQGDEADLVVAFNEQVLYSRVAAGAYGEGTRIFLESKWGESPDPEIRADYAEAVAEFEGKGLKVIPIPMEKECLAHTPNPRRGKNMWTVGFLCGLYTRDVQTAVQEVEGIFKKKGEKVVATNVNLIKAGYAYALQHMQERFQLPPREGSQTMVAMNGNRAIALGLMAAGVELCSMYPITPATSASHYLAEAFHHAGGFVHQAEDEIAAIAFAIGASYSGKTAVTVTSGPGMALKSEMIGLAVMAEIPLIIVNVQRGGPSTGLPTKVEQADLLSALYAQPGDAPRVVLAASSVEECFHMMILARKLAEGFRIPVIVLSDANLATGLSLFPRPEVREDWLSSPVDQSTWPEGLKPFEWDPETGLSARPIPGQKGGAYVLTGLVHNQSGKVEYGSANNQNACAMRSRKLATLQSTLKPPVVYGDPEGELLVVGWGSTRGYIEEAVDRLRADGHKVSSLHMRFLSPLEPGLKEIFARFEKVMTVEINYGDEPDFGEARRYSQLATVLRAATLVDIDSWSRVPGQPLPPSRIEAALRKRLKGAE
jgi:2-oxoglutarate ferredoxin oxidoreductase subunit alpha